MNDKSNGNSYYARTRARREQQGEAEFGLGYLYKSIEVEINNYGAQTGYAYSLAHTAFRLGRLLTSKALREEPGLAQLVPEMRENGPRALLRAENGPTFPVNEPTQEVHVRPRVGRPLGSKNGQHTLKATELGRPLTHEEKQANWRLQAQRQRDKYAAMGLNSSGKPRRERTMVDRYGTKRKISPKHLAAMRANAIKARAAYKAKHKVKRPMSAERRAEMSVIMRAAYAKKRAAAASA